MRNLSKNTFDFKLCKYGLNDTLFEKEYESIYKSMIVFKEEQTQEYLEIVSDRDKLVIKSDISNLEVKKFKLDTDVLIKIELQN